MICLHRELENPKPGARSTDKSPAHLQEDDLLAEARQSLGSPQRHVKRVARLVLRANAMWDPLAPLGSLASRPGAPATPRSLEPELALCRMRVPPFRYAFPDRFGSHLEILNRGNNIVSREFSPTRS